LKIGYYSSRIRSSYKLIPEEENEYYGLLLFYNPELLHNEFIKQVACDKNGKIKEPIRYYQLLQKAINLN
jgi:hypothetical protein